MLNVSLMSHLRTMIAHINQWRSRMKPTYDDIVKWMKDYFAAYNAYAQNPVTVNKMSDYFTADVRFVPYISPLRPGNAITSRDILRMFTSIRPSTRNSRSRISLSMRDGWLLLPCSMWPL